MKRIGVDLRPLMETPLTGVGNYTIQLLTALLDIDKENIYVLFYNSASAKQRAPVQRFDGYKNVVYRGFKMPNKVLNTALAFLQFPALDDLLGELDVFWAPNTGFFAFSSNKRLLKILTIHDLSFELFPEFFSQKQRLWHKLTAPRLWCEKFDKIITGSSHSAGDIHRLYGVPQEKIKIIPPPISPQVRRVHAPHLLENVRTRYRLPKRFVLFIGTKEPRKNLEGAVEAVERLNVKIREHTPLVIAGKRGWGRHPLGMKENDDIIHYIGYIREDDKPALYSLAECLLFPSLYEGFGLPLLEAMQCGTPVVTSSHSSLKEVAGSAALMIDPYNIAEIAHALEMVLTDTSLRSMLVEKAYTRGALFKPEYSARELLKLFEL